MIIYRITNKTNQKSYIGQTVGSLHRRWLRHCAKTSGCTALSNAIHKYGKENFQIEILNHCSSIEEMNHFENRYIQIFNTLAPNGYNLDIGGKNKTPSELTKSRISASQSGKKHSEDTKRKMASIKNKPVICLETGIIYASVKEASFSTNISRTSISKVLYGTRRKCGGLTFSFL